MTNLRGGRPLTALVAVILTLLSATGAVAQPRAARLDPAGLVSAQLDPGALRHRQQTLPATDPESFLRAAYLGLLGRDADPAGMRYWLDRIDRTAARSEALVAMAGTAEHRSVVVDRAYAGFLDRRADAEGRAYWSRDLIERRTERQLHAQLLSSEEFFQRAGSTNSAFIGALYRALFDREPDAPGAQYWASRLAQGTSRHQVARALVASPEAAEQPTLGIVSSDPAPDSAVHSLNRISVTLDRTINLEDSAVIVSIDGVRQPGRIVTRTPATQFEFLLERSPRNVAVGSRATVVVTILAFDGTEVTRADYGFVFAPNVVGGTLDELIVAFYGHAKTPLLGVMGEGTPDEAVQRLLAQAAPYRVDDRPVVPAFELIATLATAAPGERGTYSARTPPDLIRPYLDAIRTVDGRLVLDIQPGRADFETEARAYEQILLEPEVGLALDPEWAVGPDETPAGNIGSVDALEINRVVNYLSGLVVANDLPDKLLIVHRFRPDMVRNPEAIVERPGVIILFQADGEGSPGPKIADYDTLLPDRFARGIKVFYDEDHPRMSPVDVLSLSPRPDYVSYQ